MELEQVRLAHDLTSVAFDRALLTLAQVSEKLANQSKEIGRLETRIAAAKKESKP